MPKLAFWINLGAAVLNLFGLVFGYGNTYVNLFFLVVCGTAAWLQRKHAL